MDRNEQPDAVAFTTDNIVLHAGDAIVTDPFIGGRYEYRLFDADRRHYATLAGHHDDDGHFIIDAIRWPGGGELLPVRAEPDADRQPQPVPDRDTQPVRAGVFRHVHRHPHTDPYAPGTVAYRHTHRHFHPGDAERDRAGDADADVALHDHDH